MKTLVSVIDVGSTSSRMRIVEFVSAETAKIIEELYCPVAVGGDTFSSRKISAKTLRALCATLASFTKLNGEYGVKHVRAVATSAVRDAENRDLVIDRIFHETGVKIQALDNIEEGRLICQLLLPFLNANLTACRKHVLFMELGGGGTVSLALKKGKIVRANYRRLGTARFSLLTGLIADGEPIGENMVRHAVNDLLAQFAEFPLSEAVFLNNAMRKIVGHFADASVLNGGFRLNAEALKKQLAIVNALAKPENIAEEFGLSEDEAATLLPTMLILNYFCRAKKLDHFYLLDADLLDATQRDLQLTLNGKNPQNEFREQTLLSARGVGEKYNYDEKHALAVAGLSAQLCEDLARFFDLSARDLLLLEIAATLHDVGSFISEEAHHKHSQYIIQYSEILGVDRLERGVIAIIARYHRKAVPLSTHGDYANMNLEDRLRVSKLAAILRIADALDRSHSQTVRRVETKIKADTLQITAFCRGDITLEQMAIKEKSAMFEAVAGLTVELHARPLEVGK